MTTVEHARKPEVISGSEAVNERQAKRFAEEPELISISRLLKKWLVSL